MATELPPDPYIALGVPRDATAAAIKTAYRKLVLKFHPDKVQDEAQKQIASDQFHKIQTAYEIVGDEDRRGRYDAQVRLQSLKREVAEKQGSTVGSRVDVRTAAFKVPVDTPGRTTFTARGPERGPEKVHVEERRPYEDDYFARPRASAKRDYDYERPKRSSPRDEKERVRVSRQEAKENERVRHKEKAKQSTRDARRERDYKYSYGGRATSSDSDSESPNERARRQRKSEDDARKGRDAYAEQSKRYREDIYAEDRSRKASAAEANARDYIERSRGASRQYSERERRPSPSRVASNNKVEYIKRGEGRPAVMVRRGSGRPSTSGRDADESPQRSRRERTRRMSEEYDELPARRPPPFVQTKSAPGDIRLPSEPKRAYSMQTDFEHKEDFQQPPPMRRAETMPMQPTRREDRKAPKQSKLRTTEISDGLPTPSATPVDTAAPRYPYGKEYADDGEYATPNGYRTEVREPGAGSRKVTRSPSPMKEDRGRAASSRYPEASPRPQPQGRTTSYVYTKNDVDAMRSSRPSLSRNESSRRASDYQTLYGEIPTTRSPRVNRSKYSPPPEEVRYQREVKPEDVRYQTGYSSRRASERPHMSRESSYRQPVY